MEPLRLFKINQPVVIHEIIDEEVVIIHFNSGNYYSLDKSGADIWSFIEHGATVREIVEGIVHRYEGNHTVIEEAVNNLIAELQKEDLIIFEDLIDSGTTAGTGTRNELKAKEEKAHFEAPVLHKYADMQDLLLLDPIHEVDEMGWPIANPKTVKDDE